MRLSPGVDRVRVPDRFNIDWCIGLMQRVRLTDGVGQLGCQAQSARVTGDSLNNAGTAHIHQAALVAREGEGTHCRKVMCQRLPAVGGFRASAKQDRVGMVLQ